MKPKITVIPGGITAPKGFLCGGVFCGIKHLGTGKGSEKGEKPDLALIVSTVPAVAAGMFTTNQVKAAPVIISQRHLKSTSIRAIVANSGNANACTGTRGLSDARTMCALAAEFLSRAAKPPQNILSLASLPIRPSQVLVASTGRIGIFLPMARIKQGIESVVQTLGASPEHSHTAALAIMTSDTKPKEYSVEFRVKEYSVRVGGICKGAGMIHPRMSPTGKRPFSVPTDRLHATMLCFITTDIAIERTALQVCLEEAVAQTFNRITVDGDTSTNDTVLAMANGVAANPPITLQHFRRESGVCGVLARTFFEALVLVCEELSKMIVRDGEGVHRKVLIKVTGALSLAQADAVARTVANSPLVKTSWHGGDPNWGRIMCAIGYCAVPINPNKVDIGYSIPGSRTILWCVRKGVPTQIPFEKLCQTVQSDEFVVHINLNSGRYTSHIFAADLTESYVDFNKGNIDDPSSLGG